MFRELTSDSILNMLKQEAIKKGKAIFIVGGAVRDKLLNKTRVEGPKDLDVTGSFSLEELEEIFKRKDISYVVKNRKLEVLSFKEKRGFCVEYARLRKEKYEDSYRHNPTEVVFVETIEEDTKRRDFTINSLYYDRHNTSLLDPTKRGIKDLKNKTIRMVQEDTLSSDPARIIRLIELKCRLDFKVERKTLLCAKKYAKNVFSLSKPRLEKELNRLFLWPKYVNESEKYLRKVNETLKDFGLDKFCKNLE